MTDRLPWPGQRCSAPPRADELSRLSWKHSPIPTQSSSHSHVDPAAPVHLFLGSRSPPHSVQRRNIWRGEAALLRDLCLPNTATSKVWHWMVQPPLPALPRVPGLLHARAQGTVPLPTLPVGRNRTTPALGSPFPGITESWAPSSLTSH